MPTGNERIRVFETACTVDVLLRQLDLPDTF